MHHTLPLSLTWLKSLWAKLCSWASARLSGSRLQQDPQQILARRLMSIQPDIQDRRETKMVTVNLADKLPLPYMASLALLLGTECKFTLRPHEKTAWICRMIFRGIPLQLEHAKFGMHLSMPTDTSQELVNEFLKLLTGAFSLVDRALEPIIETQTKAGHFSIPSLFYKLDSKYRFFRERAEAAYSAHPDHSNREIEQMFEDAVAAVRKEPTETTSIGKTYRPMERMWEGFYYGSAAIEAYFSRLEYLMIVTLAFTTFDPIKSDLLELIGSSWKAKIKAALDLTANKEAQRLYDSLLQIKRRYRDPLAHGGLDRDGSELYVHIPKFGAVPVLLSRYEGSLHYNLVPVTDVSFREACRVFDNLDNYLQSHAPERYAYKWARYGMQVAFDKDSLAGYRAATSSDEAFDEFLEYMSHLVDEATNMDW